MLIYKIPSDIYENTKAIPGFTQAFLDAELTSPLVDSCLFEIVTAEESREHLQTVECVYLVIPDYYESYFQDLLIKYSATKLTSLPLLTNISVIAGDLNAIHKASHQ